MSVCQCLTLRTEQLDSHCEDIHEVLRFRIFRKPVENFDFSLYSDQIEGYFM